MATSPPSSVQAYAAKPSVTLDSIASSLPSGALKAAEGAQAALLSAQPLEPKQPYAKGLASVKDLTFEEGRALDEAQRSASGVSQKRFATFSNALFSLQIQALAF